MIAPLPSICSPSCFEKIIEINWNIKSIPVFYGWGCRIWQLLAGHRLLSFLKILFELLNIGEAMTNASSLE